MCGLLLSHMKFLLYFPFRNRKFNEEDAFIGYQKDTPAAAVFQATNQLEKLRQRHPGLVQMWAEVLESRCLGFTLDDITEEVTSDSDQYQQMVIVINHNYARRSKLRFMTHIIFGVSLSSPHLGDKADASYLICSPEALLSKVLPCGYLP